MQVVIYAATRYGYCVQVIDGGDIVYEYTAGNWKLPTGIPDRHRRQVPQRRQAVPTETLGQADGGGDRQGTGDCTGRIRCRPGGHAQGTG